MSDKLKFRRALLLSWLIPLILLFVAPMAVIGLLHNNSVNAIRRDAEHAYTLELTNLKNIVDFHLINLNQIALDLSFNTDVASFLSATQIGSYERLLSRSIQARLREYSLTNNAISYIAIGNFDTNFVISNESSYTINDFMALRFDNTNHHYSHLQANVQINAYTVLRNPENNREFISYTLSLPLELGSQFNGFVTIFISDQFFQMLTDGLVNRSLLISVGDDVLRVGNYIRSDDYITLQLNSAIAGISYIYTMHSAGYDTTIQRVSLITWISVSICIILCILILIYFMHQNFAPIARIAQNLHNNEDNIPIIHKGKLSHILDSFASKINESNQLNLELKSHRNIVRDMLIAKLLLGDITSEELQSVKSLDGFKDDMFFVAAIKTSELYGEEKDYNIFHNTIKNIVSDLNEKGYHAYSLVLHGALISILNCQEDSVNSLLSYLKNVPSILEVSLDADFCVGISQTCDRLDDISVCYAQAVETLSYCVMFNRSSAIYKTDYRLRIDYASNRIEHFEANKKFRNSIVIADFKEARNMVDSLFEVSFYPDQSTNEVQLNIYSIVTLLCSSLVEFSERHNINELSIENINSKLIQSLTIDQLKDNVVELLRYLEEQYNDFDNFLLEKFKNDVIKYIELNYQDYELSVGGIAAHFDVSVSYTSKTFKKQTGVGLLSYIHQVRLKHAKELLAEKKYSIKEIATMVGFNDSTSFIRTFKKHEGVSPGRY